MKIVRESLYEKFEPTFDPVEDMRIGTSWKQKLAIKFLERINRDQQLDKSEPRLYAGELVVDEYTFGPGDLKTGFEEFVENPDRYEEVLDRLGLEVRSRIRLEGTSFTRK